jgi:poly-gamma-glutamate capsule biosynthesis protein CapA/YwtB (metallophosphatase superfamily)
VRLFLAGDVMTGRGIDQVLGHPVDPVIYERWVKSAMEYVHLAERRNGPIPRRAEPSYIWGDAIAALDARKPDVRIINLETAVTDRGEPWPGKGIHYRMHPENIDSITAAGIDVCVLANNHVMDWSYEGLGQTLATVTKTGMSIAGAGAAHDSAWTPAIVNLEPGKRLFTLGVGTTSSGVPSGWQARESSPGVAMVEVGSVRHVEAIARRIRQTKKDGDIAVLSIHWGPNWGYEIPPNHRGFARDLIDEAEVDIVHGHSSHHPLGIEVHNGKPILYGCGDLINDYEGIRGHEEYRPDLRVLFIVDLGCEGELKALELIPMRTHRFSLVAASAEENDWLASKLAGESRGLGTHITVEEGRLFLRW